MICIILQFTIKLKNYITLTSKESYLFHLTLCSVVSTYRLCQKKTYNGIFISQKKMKYNPRSSLYSF